MNHRKVMFGFLSVLAGVILLIGLAPAAPAGAVDSTFMAQFAKVFGEDTATGDGFGFDVAISGDTAVVGAPFEDAEGSDAGAAYVFRRSGAGWAYHGKLTADDGQAGDNFGWSVAIYEGTIFIGAPGDDDLASNNGAAYVFTRTYVMGSGVPWWRQRVKLTGGTDSDARFGESVAVSSGYGVVSAPFYSNQGCAYVFTGSGASWTNAKQLWGDDSVSDDQFGTAVAAGGGIIIVGAQGDDDGGSAAGSAYVFTGSGSNWDQEAKLNAAADAGAGAYFGFSVAISGNTAVVGAYGADTSRGTVYVFNRVYDSNLNRVWPRQAKLVAPDAAVLDEFGWAVGVSGDTAVIGASGDDSDRGSAYVFTRVGSLWTQQKKVAASDGAAGDTFGRSVAVLNGTAFIGASHENQKGTDAGATYILNCLGPVYRFYNKRIGTHFYTPNEAEKASVIANLSGTYAYEGVAYKVNPYNNTQSLHRFFNKRNGSHFYTASEAEKANVIANLSATYSYDGPTYKVSTASGGGKTPVYRFYNKRNGSHFYTADETERSNVINTLAGVYTYEGVAFHLGM